MMLAATAKEARQRATKMILKRLLLKDGIYTAGRFRAIAKQVALQESRVLPTAKFLPIFADTTNVGAMDEMDVQILLASCSHTAWEGTIDSRRFLASLKSVNSVLHKDAKSASAAAGDQVTKKVVFFSSDASSRETHKFYSVMRHGCNLLQEDNVHLKLVLKKHKFNSNVKHMMGRASSETDPAVVVLFDAKDLICNTNNVVQLFKETFPNIKVVLFGNEDDLRLAVESLVVTEEDYKDRLFKADEFIRQPTTADGVARKFQLMLGDQNKLAATTHWTLLQNVVPVTDAKPALKRFGRVVDATNLDELLSRGALSEGSLDLHSNTKSPQSPDAVRKAATACFSRARNKKGQNWGQQQTGSERRASVMGSQSPTRRSTALLPKVANILPKTRTQKANKKKVIGMAQSRSKSFLLASPISNDPKDDDDLMVPRKTSLPLTSIKMPRTSIQTKSLRFWTRARSWRIDSYVTDQRTDNSGLEHYGVPSMETAAQNADFIHKRRVQSKPHPGKCWAPKELKRNINDIEKTMQTWDFSIFQLAKKPSVMGSPLVTVAYVALNSSRFSLGAEFDVGGEQMVSFLHSVEAGYMDSPYHNSRHAADVTQGMYFLLSFGGLHEIMKLTNMEIFAMLLATACHDVGHPGINNGFLCSTADKTAIQFNDQHVLENFHCSLALGLLHQTENNFLARIASPIKSEFRRLFIGSILATDLADHGIILGQFKKQLSGDFDMTDAKNRSLALKMTIKAVDISHATRSWPVHKRFSNMINEEFFNQGDMELAKGLPVSNLCDRHKVKVNQSQVGFIKYMITPFFNQFCTFLKSSGNNAADRMLQNISSNGKQWQRLADIQTREEKEAAEAQKEKDDGKSQKKRDPTNMIVAHTHPPPHSNFWR